jgi:subtilisin family serine protease
MDKLQDCMSKHIFMNDSRSQDKVKIAILDTGIDHDHIAIRALKRRNSRRPICIKEWKNFIAGSYEEDPDAATQDSHGHGTHIAALVSRVAPAAQIYIARISKNEDLTPDNRVAEVKLPIPHLCLVLTPSRQ